jgi:hypothetical protein
MNPVVVDVELLDDGPLRGYDEPQPRVRLTWGQGRKPWVQIEHAGFLLDCEELPD